MDQQGNQITSGAFEAHRNPHARRLADLTLGRYTDRASPQLGTTTVPLWTTGNCFRICRTRESRIVRRRVDKQDLDWFSTSLISMTLKPIIRIGWQRRWPPTYWSWSMGPLSVECSRSDTFQMRVRVRLELPRYDGHFSIWANRAGVP